MRSFVSPHHDRIAKLSEKLSSLQSSITVERSGRMDSVETQLGIIDENFRESHDLLSKKYNGLKEEIVVIKAGIEEERMARERYIGEKMQEVRELEDGFVQRMEAEAAARKEMENKFYRQLEDRAASLRQDLLRDFKLNLSDLEHSNAQLAEQLAPVQETAAEARNAIDELETRLRVQVDESVDKLTNEVVMEKNLREETEEAMLQMLRDVIGQIKSGLDQERKDREETEENLLNLLEETCSKLTQL